MSEALENIQHSTFNIEPRIGCRVAFHSTLNVECWALNVLPFPGGPP
jgi:hypothetical protein